MEGILFNPDARRDLTRKKIQVFNYQEQRNILECVNRIFCKHIIDEINKQYKIEDYELENALNDFKIKVVLFYVLAKVENNYSVFSIINIFFYLNENGIHYYHNIHNVMIFMSSLRNLPELFYNDKYEKR